MSVLKSIIRELDQHFKLSNFFVNKTIFKNAKKY